MKSKLPMIARVLLGLLFFAAGLTGLLNLVPQPTDLPPKLMAFNSGLAATGYFFPFLKATETICGLLLLTGLFVPLALVVLAPIVINILLVHSFLAPEGLPVALTAVALTAYLSFFARPYASVIRSLFRAHRA